MKTELPRNAGFIIAESPGDISRSNITLHGGFTGATFLLPGSVLGKISATGKYALSADSGGDGSQTAVAVLVNYADISGGDVQAAVIDMDATVIGAALVYDATVDDPTKTAAKVTQLRAVGIKAR